MKKIYPVSFFLSSLIFNLTKSVFILIAAVGLIIFGIKYPIYQTIGYILLILYFMQYVALQLKIRTSIITQNEDKHL